MGALFLGWKMYTMEQQPPQKKRVLMLFISFFASFDFHIRMNLLPHILCHTYQCHELCMIYLLLVPPHFYEGVTINTEYKKISATTISHSSQKTFDNSHFTVRHLLAT